MKEFFSNMESGEQIYWYIAIISSIIFIIQTILTFVGADTDTGIDADFDGDLDGGGHAFQLFSLRNLINFFVGASWTGVAFYKDIDNKFLVGLLAFVVGLIFIAVFFFIMKAIYRLAEDNSFKIEDTMGKSAEVYLTIPAHKKGRGRVQISVNGSVHELDAITTNEETLSNGTLVKVVNIKDNILVVEPI